MMSYRLKEKRCFITCAFLLLIAISCVSSQAVDDEEAWKEFKRQFDRNYSSPAEEEMRKSVFLDNKHYIDSQNTKSKGTSFTQGINHLSDLTAEEIISTRTGFRLDRNFSAPSDERRLEGLLETLLVSLNSTTSDESLRDQMSNVTDQRAWYEHLLSPEKLDYRWFGRVSRVKDQGSCGSCWAFATTGALEGIISAQNRSILLSEQNLVDCAGQRYGNHGCRGGLMGQALRYVRDHGIMASRDYPYTAREGKCRFNPNRSVTRVRGSVTLPRGNEALLRLALALTGPLPVAIDAGPRSFHSYKSGVYDDTACRNTENALNHAVLLVGYGREKVGGDYWLLKNSWGTKWGDRGYIKIARNRSNKCGIASYAVLPIP